MITVELRALQDVVRQFANDVIAPVIAKHYEDCTFPYEVISKIGDLGLFGLPFSEEYGGGGGDYFALCLVLEEIARVDSSVAITLEAAVSLGAMPIYKFGTEEQKQEWLPQLSSGRIIGAFGLTEPEAGSDAGGTKTTARLEGGEWLINGSKSFITNSGTDITGLITVIAVTGTLPNGDKEISTIIVPAGTPGLIVAPKYSKVGWNASDTHELTFSDVRVPESNLLGIRGQGFAQFLRIVFILQQTIAS
jgi:alkylation response protein AidB-like acyl-CoA dehydrogenase